MRDRNGKEWNQNGCKLNKADFFLWFQTPVFLSIVLCKDRFHSFFFYIFRFVIPIWPCKQITIFFVVVLCLCALCYSNKNIFGMVIECIWSYRVVAVVAGNSEAVTLTGLTPDTQYQLTVTAVWNGKKFRSRPIVFRTLGKWNTHTDKLILFFILFVFSFFFAICFHFDAILTEKCFDNFLFSLLYM